VRHSASGRSGDCIYSALSRAIPVAYRSGITRLPALRPRCPVSRPVAKSRRIARHDGTAPARSIMGRWGGIAFANHMIANPTTGMAGRGFSLVEFIGGSLTAGDAVWSSGECQWRVVAQTTNLTGYVQR
jgi:hypothetical protein